jgi:hypothetical protein
MNQIEFEFEGNKYVVDGEVFYLDHIILPNGTLLKVVWIEEIEIPTIKVLEREFIPVTLAGATNEELAEIYRGIIALSA